LEPELLETVAVNVTGCPELDGFNDEVNVVEVLAWVTDWLNTPPLAEQFALPP
jgi:hypothetical protein